MTFELEGTIIYSNIDYPLIANYIPFGIRPPNVPPIFVDIESIDEWHERVRNNNLVHWDSDQFANPYTMDEIKEIIFTKFKLPGSLVRNN